MKSPALIVGCTILALGGTVAAVIPQWTEFLASHRWASRILGPGLNVATAAYLEGVAEDVADGITRGQSWRGTSYQIGDRVYTHGIAFNANKCIRIHLGRPAARFTAEVGLENNDDTRRGAALGQGSVTFHVRVKDREVFASPIRRLKDGPLRLDVPLDGADSFDIAVRDGGDGRGWDQALWADAMVQLQDGNQLRLQDLPGLDSLRLNPYGFSFLYQGSPSADCLASWFCEVPNLPLEARQSARMVTRRDPVTGLEVRVEGIAFADFPAVEWTVYLTNTSSKDTPLLESIQALDAVLPLPVSGPTRLHWAKGAVASFDDFAPQEETLKPGRPIRLQPGGGRSSSQVLPFFNLESGSGGIVAAIGWSGEWAAEFACDARGLVRMKAGMAQTRLVLHPGEGIRTPRMLLLFYEGDRWRGQNLLRQFLLAHHRPERSGKPLVAPITCGNWGATRAEVHLDNVRKIIEHQLPVEYYWIDAEWYGQPGGPGTWARNVGNWAFKKDQYPDGFKPISDALRRSGRELLLWFEPERVHKDTPWHQQHREWLIDIGGDSCLLNLGNPTARKFLTDFISDRIEEFGLGCYRQDFNIDPLPFWKSADATNRQGIAEIRYIEGLYAFWDELRRRHPSLIIDNCASGGRRIDLETIGRATPFWRTDGPRDAIAHQCHTQGLLAWIPLSATSQDRASDDYEFRSSMCSGLCLNWWVSGDAPAERIPANFPFRWARHTLRQYLEMRPFYYGDFYPLTAYSQTRDTWMAYQLDRPDLGQGWVVALRRPQSPYVSARLRLQGLNPDARYRVSNLDSGEQKHYTGEVLQREGLDINLKSQPGSALLRYVRTRGNR